jgi:hypothetical protein
MIKRKAIGLLLCLLLSIQTLPVAAVGLLLHQDQIAGELQGTDDAPGKAISFAAELDKYITHSIAHQPALPAATSINYCTEPTYSIKAPHVKDVQTPPPNKAWFFIPSI